MKKKVIVVGDENIGNLLGLLAVIMGGEFREVEVEEPARPTVKEPEFDINQYTKPGIPKVAVRLIPSNSKLGKMYRVSADKEGNLYCECKGFMYRGTCRHVDTVKRVGFVNPLAPKPMPMVFEIEGTPIQTFHSINHPGTIYTVKVKDGDFVCTCRGFNFHGDCKHVSAVRRNTARPIRL